MRLPPAQGARRVASEPGQVPQLIPRGPRVVSGRHVASSDRSTGILGLGAAEPARMPTVTRSGERRRPNYGFDVSKHSLPPGRVSDSG